MYAFGRRRRYRRKRQRGRRTKRNGFSLARRAYQLARRIDTRAERKYWNQNYSSSLATTYNTFCPLEIPQGDSGTLRDGDQIDLRYIRLRVSFESTNESNLSTQRTPCYVRFVVVQDYQQQNSTAIPTGAVFLDTASGSSWNSVYNFPGGAGRFKILYDRTINVTPNTLAVAAGALGNSYYSLSTLRHFSCKIMPKRRQIRWNDTNGTSFQKNIVYCLMAKSNNGYTVTPDIRAQTCFIDS